MWPSLPPDVFKATAAEAGINLKNLEEVFSALPLSCQSFLLNGGHEALTGFKNTQAEIRAGAGFQTIRVKTCVKCGVSKNASEFQKNNKTSDGLRGDCRKCERERSLKLKYGLSSEDIARMLAEQGGACAICRDSEVKNWCIDHDHSSGKVRAVLCGYCNSAIGFLRDSYQSATAAAEYLIKHNAASSDSPPVESTKPPNDEIS